MTRIQTASDLMHRDVATVRPEMSAEELAVFFTEEGVHGAPVVDGEDRLVGMISRTDLVRGIAESTDDVPNVTLSIRTDDQEFVDIFQPCLTTIAQGTYLTVRHIMTTQVVEADAKMTAGELATLMHRDDIHRVVVVSEGRVVGLVSATDLLPVLAEMEVELRARGSRA